MTKDSFLRGIPFVAGPVCLALAFSSWAAQVPSGQPEPALFKQLKFRNVGPANMGGRIGAVEGVAGSNVIYVGTAAGGIFKTANAGVSWKPIFDDQGTSSIGAIAVAPSDPNVVYVGTGEGNPRNSASVGDGVYKSTDGGESWSHVGLRDTETIPRMRVHPSDPNTVWVAAMGHKWGPNEERGIFRTTDGGKSWQKVLYLDQDTGASDLDIDFSNPRFVYAALYQFRRTPYSLTSGGPGSGIYRSSDGGATFQKVSQGLPEGIMGRIGLAAARSRPGVVYAMVESKEGVLYRSDDYGWTWKSMNSDPELNDRPFYYTDLRVDPSDENRLYSVGDDLKRSRDGGRTWETIGRGIHGDHQALWIDPANSLRVLNGNDGGFTISYDGAQSWDYVTQFAIGQFYHVNFNMAKPYWVGGGLQDNGSWIGPSRTRHRAGILNDDWIRVYGGDGFYVVWQDENTLYTNSQGGNLSRVDLRTGEQKRIVPYPVPLGGSGAADHPYRFNWNAPVVISPHDPKVVYLGGNVLWKTTDGGQNWTAISPDLTTNDRSKLGPSGGPITLDNSTAEFHCTIVAVAESPLTPGLIWVGTDDGQVQLTRDGGKSWTNLIGNIKSVPPNSWVPMIEASRFDAGTAYLLFDRHRSNDMKPYLFKTTDYGQSWRDITGSLPAFGYTWVVREDPRNRNLLYVGTELGLYLAWDGGSRWARYPGLPTVPVNDLVIHPRENDLILATHGRSIFILDDVTALQQVSPEAISSEAHLFDIRPAVRFEPWNQKASLGQKVFVAENPPYGALITYYLRSEAKEEPGITITDSTGAVIRQLKGTKLPGINRVAWDLRYEDAWMPESERQRQAESFFGSRGGPQVLPGEYAVKLSAGGRELSKAVKVELDGEIRAGRTELEKQLATLLRLRDMTTAVNRAIERIGTLQDQLKRVAETVKRSGTVPTTSDERNGGESQAGIGRSASAGAAQATAGPGAELAAEIEALSKRLSDQRARLTREGPGAGLAKPAALKEKMTSLVRSVDSAHSTPTTAEMEYLEKFDVELKKELSGLNDIVSKAIPDLNGRLRRANVPHVAPGEALR